MTSTLRSLIRSTVSDLPVAADSKIRHLTPLFHYILVLRFESLGLGGIAVSIGIIDSYGLAAAVAVKLFDEPDAYLAVSVDENV